MTTSEFTKSVRTETARQAAPGRVLRPVLWLLVAVCATVNVVTQTMHLNPFISVGFGVLTASFGVVLGVHYYRHRRSVAR